MHVAYRNTRHFLIPWTSGSFAPLGPFLSPPLKKKRAYCPKVRALGPVLTTLTVITVEFLL
jgi:hypothetical protein